MDSKEMKEGLHSIGMWLTDEEFERLMKCADPDGDGDVMYAEFAELLDHAMMTRDGRNAGAARQAAALEKLEEPAELRGAVDYVLPERLPPHSLSKERVQLLGLIMPSSHALSRTYCSCGNGSIVLIKIYSHFLS